MAVSYVRRETPELTFMEVYDVRWVTNFEEKLAEMTADKKGECVYLFTFSQTFFFFFSLLNEKFR